MLVWYCIFKAVYFSFISEIGLYPNEPSNVMEYNGEFKLMDVLGYVGVWSQNYLQCLLSFVIISGAKD